MEKFDTEGRDDINQKSKEEFSSAVNKQKGRVSKRLIKETSFISTEQKKSWNEEGFILLKDFCSEKFCDDMNQKVIEIIHAELVHAMAAAGCRDIQSIDRSIVRTNFA